MIMKSLRYIVLLLVAVMAIACSKGPSGQLLDVVPTGKGSNAKITLWVDGKKIFTTDGYIGRAGVGKTREGDMKTPLDTMHILGAFGIKPNPGTSMPYIDITPTIFACGDEEYYNQVIDTALVHHHNCSGEEMYRYQPHYNYGLITDYNSDCVYGKGAAIFVHCKGPNPYTAGCISMDEERMVDVLRHCDTTLRVFVHPMPAKALREGPSVAFFGSSVCRGVGADSLRGYAWQVQKHILTTDSLCFPSVNISVDGNNTYDLLARFNNDVLTTNAKYVVFGVSLGNEGLHEHGEAALLSYRENMQRLISMVSEAGRVPVVCNNYGRADFNPVDYQDLIEVNMEVQQWEVPTINIGGVVDDGAGHWAKDYWDGEDTYHPNTAGHTEMFTAFPPSLFQALEQGKPLPERKPVSSDMLSEQRQTVEFTAEGVLHSFTLSYAKHDTTVTTVYSFARQTIWKYMNGELIEEETHVGQQPNDFRVEGVGLHDLFFYRAPLNAKEVKALATGSMLRSSLEIYAPLVGENAEENLAQSLSKIKLRTE